MQIETTIKQFIIKHLYFTEDQTLDDDASFLDTGIVDSTGVMELVAFLQSTFAIKIEPEDIVVENFDSIKKTAHFVRRKLSLPDGSPIVTAIPETKRTLVHE